LVHHGHRTKKQTAVTWPATIGGYVVRDANGQAIAYVYSRATETDAMQAKVLTDDGLPELLR
jgi:hypothetical protein